MKSFKPAMLGMAFSLLALSAAPIARGAEPVRGSWTIAPSKQAGMVQFAILYRRDGGESNHQSDWPVSTLQGLDLATPGRHDVKFTFDRDAGRFDGQGFMNGGEGAGTFHFTANPDYVPAMRKLGFEDIDEEMQFAMAVHDVSLEFARGMQAEKLSGLDTDKLIAFRIFDVNSQFIHELRATGLPAVEADKLIAFRVHGVTPELVKSVRKAGFDPDEDQLIAMRVHGVTPEYIAQMRSRGLKDLTIDRLLELKIHDIN